MEIQYTRAMLQALLGARARNVVWFDAFGNVNERTLVLREQENGVVRNATVISLFDPVDDGWVDVLICNIILVE